MAKHIEDEIAYHYDLHPTEEDLMGETMSHTDLIEYLTQVLRWLFHEHTCTICKNLNFYQTSNRYEKPLVPDIAVIKGISHRRLKSWRVGRHGPSPQVVFEVLSSETWQNDMEEKPIRYAFMGVQEYFVYDPNETPLVPDTSQRLFGWQLDNETGVMYPLQTTSNEYLWSPHLESWLVPDNEYLRLYDRYGQLRLTQAEAEAQRADHEARRAEVEAQRANREAKRAEAEARRAAVLAEELRLLGIDPDTL